MQNKQDYRAEKVPELEVVNEGINTLQYKIDLTEQYSNDPEKMAYFRVYQIKDTLKFKPFQ